MGKDHTVLENNRQFQEMFSSVRDRLQVREPGDIARCTGMDWNGTYFAVCSFGAQLQISWPDCTIIPAQDMWNTLVLLQYMLYADGAALTERYISLCEFREGGLVRGNSFDRENDRIIRGIGKHDAALIRRAAAKLGGEELRGKADLSFRFWFLPRYPMQLNLWLEDEEFPASGKILLEAATESSLQVEAAGMLSGVLLENLRKICEQMGSEI